MPAIFFCHRVGFPGGGLWVQSLRGISTCCRSGAQDLQTTCDPAFRGFHLRRHPRSKWTSFGPAHVQKLGRLLQSKTALQQPLTLASANFSEVRSLNKKCGMKSIDLAAQLRNLGLKNGCEVSRSKRIHAQSRSSPEGIPTGERDRRMTMAVPIERSGTSNQFR